MLTHKHNRLSTLNDPNDRFGTNGFLFLFPLTHDFHTSVAHD